MSIDQSLQDYRPSVIGGESNKKSAEKFTKYLWKCTKCVSSWVLIDQVQLCNSSTSTSHLFWFVLSLSKPAFAVISSRNCVNTKTIQLTVFHEATIKSIRRASKFNRKCFCDYNVLLWRNSHWTHHFNIPSAEITLLPTKTNIFQSLLRFKIPAANNIR